MCDDHDWPQAGRERIIVPPPVALLGSGETLDEVQMMKDVDEHRVFMMGDNPALPRMPDKPTLLDFFRYRITGFTLQHLLGSAGLALQEGQDEKVVLAALLHDIANGCLIRADHGYWGAQLIAPYVSEEIAWAVRMHQPLRYFADESVGYDYPASYHKFFGQDYSPPAYIRQAAETARNHRWYMTSRLVTLYDRYLFDDVPCPDPEVFTDVIGRHFREPAEGLGFDDSPTAHMWRTLIWPNNFL